MTMTEPQQLLADLADQIPVSLTIGATTDPSTPDSSWDAMVIVRVELEPQRALLADAACELGVVAAAIAKLPGFFRILLAIGAREGTHAGLIVIPFGADVASVLRWVERRRGFWLSDDQDLHAEQGEARRVQDGTTRWVELGDDILAAVRGFLGAVT